MSDKLINWSLAGLLACALAGAHLLDVTDMSFELAQAQEVEQAQRDAQRTHRLQQAAAHMCGSENAVAIETPAGIQCRTKRGHKTTFVAMAGGVQ